MNPPAKPKPPTTAAKPRLSSRQRAQRLQAMLQRQRRDIETKMRMVVEGKMRAVDLLRLKRTDGVKFAGFAVTLLDENDLAGAEAAATVATAADPACFEAWMVLGASLARQHQERRALEAYAQAAELKPNDVRLWCDVGELKLILLDYDGAAKALKFAIDADPKAETPAGRRAQALVAKTYAKLKKGR